MADGIEWPPTKEDLERLYLAERLSAARIAKVCGLKYKNAKVAESIVLYQLKKNGIKRRDAAEHVRKVTELMVDEWARRYQEGESLKQIAGKAVSPVTVFLHLRKRDIKLRGKVEAQIQAVTKHERHRFNGSKTDEAYLVGFSKGDCQALRHGRAVRVRTSTTHLAMANLFEALFGQYGVVKRYARHSTLVSYEWSLEVDLDDSFGFLLRTIENSFHEYARSADTFLSFLAGFADAEGSIYFHTKGMRGSFEISITNTNVRLLRNVKDSLGILGHYSKVSVVSQKPNRLWYEKSGKVARLYVWRHSDVIRLLQLLPMRHQEKRRKADLALAYMEHNDKKFRDDILSKWDALKSDIDRDRREFVMEAERQYLAKHGPSDSQTSTTVS